MAREADIVSGSSNLNVARMAWCLFATAAVLALGALAVQAYPGTGFEIATDPMDQPASRYGLDIVRLGATTSLTGSTFNEGSLDYYIAVNTFSASPPGLPRHPDSNDFAGALATAPGPGFQLQFYVNGDCYQVRPSNSPGGGNSWNSFDLMFAGTCTPGGSPVSCYCGITWVNAITAEWVCNEAHIHIPRYWLYVDPQPPPANGDPAGVINGFSFGGGNPATVHDQMAAGVVGTFNWGAAVPNPNPTALTAVYVPTPGPARVDLSWQAPLGGNTVTGYRIERRMMPAGPFSTIYTSPASLTPATTYSDIPAPGPGTWEYKVTALRCNDLSVIGGSVVAQVTVTGTPPPPVLTPAFQANQGIYATCQDSRVVFTDLSLPVAEPIATWAWDFGDGTPVSNLQNPLHTFADPGTYSVRLTITDSASPPRTAYVVVPVTSIGDPNCCPVVLPLDSILATEGDTISFIVRSTDYENDARVHDVQVGEGVQPLPAHAMDGVTGEFTWVTGPGDARMYQLVLSAADATCTSYEGLLVNVRPKIINSIDDDNDGVAGAIDNCPAIPNFAQEDADHDGVGDACDAAPCGPSSTTLATSCVGNMPPPSPMRAKTDVDRDHDGRPDVADNCGAIANHNQLDTDGDNLGDVCDIDIDGDGIVNGADNCALKANPDQADTDLDGTGNACGDASLVGAAASPPRGMAGANPAKEVSPLDAQMPRIGLGALAFVVLVVALIFAVSRLRK